jgi:alanine racemase
MLDLNSVSEGMMQMPPLQLKLDVTALRRNFSSLRKLAGANQHFIAAIKANAYGHGAVAVARILQSIGVHSLATGSVDEAQAIRDAGVDLPILLFASTLPDDIPELVSEGFIPTITSLDGARAVAAAVTGEAPIYIKVDAGLGRLGIPIANAFEAIRAIHGLPHLQLQGLYTHVSFKDDVGRSWAAGRLAAFDRLVAALHAQGIDFAVTQARASSAVLSGLEDRCNAVCIGHALFGLYPFPIELACTQELLPVIAQLSSQLIQVTQHGQGADLAIANEFGLDRDRIIGVLPVGLAHGISRPAPGKTSEVLVRGRRIPVLAVSLEHITVDLTRCPDAEVTDTVMLLGQSEDASIKLEEYARWRNESSLESLMHLSGHAHVVCE